MKKIGFDNEKYLKMQSKKISDRIAQFGGKLYLEFGGKLFDDYHASRVLPGFSPDSKIKMLYNLKEEAEIVIAISADDIAKNKTRGDLGITYDMDVFRLIDEFRNIGFYVGSVVITHYQPQRTVEIFKKRLENKGIEVYLHYIIPDYPANIPLIVSDEGLGKNDYIKTKRSLVVVTAPGPGSGKMATCLSQLYHDYKRGIKAGYAKYETFPIWSLPLKHPVNLAYEAATADLNDVNMIDPFHLEAYGETTVNYNRDVEIFPVLNTMFEKIMGSSPYKSPTDMGVNMIGSCIFDDEAVCEASKQEIIRRYYDTICGAKLGKCEPSEVYKLEMLMSQAGVTTDDRAVVKPCLKKAEETENAAVAIELSDGTMVTGKTSRLLGASAAAILNALKILGDIKHDIPLISAPIIESIQNLKVNHFMNKNPRLHSNEILMALSICASTNPTAELALKQLIKLKDCEAHSSVILAKSDESVFRKLGVNITAEPKYQSDRLYQI